MKAAATDLFCIGANWSLVGKAGFATAKLILRHADGSLMLAKSSPSPGIVEGEELDERDWRGLQDAGEATRIDPPVQVPASASLWIFRKSFGEERDAAINDLRQLQGSIVQEVHSGPEAIAIIVDEQVASSLREDWAVQAYDRAFSLAATKGDLESALVRASLAWSLGSPRDPRRLGLLAALHELAGNKTKAESYVGLARRSWGEVVGRAVEQQRAQIRDDLIRRIAAATLPVVAGRARGKVRGFDRRNLDYIKPAEPAAA